MKIKITDYCVLLCRFRPTPPVDIPCSYIKMSLTLCRNMLECSARTPSVRQSYAYISFTYYGYNEFHEN